MKCSEQTVERALVRQFRQQHGLITSAQAQAAGVSRHVIAHRLATGQWSRVYRGVYALSGMATTPEQIILAACLAAGRGALASHHAAAWLQGILPDPPTHPSVTVPITRHPVVPGARVHRSGSIATQRRQQARGVWCTEPVRTLLDVAASSGSDTLDLAIDRSLTSRLVTLPSLIRAASGTSPAGRRGAPALGYALRRRGFVGAPHPSVLESRTLRLLRGAGIRPSATEVVAGPDGEFRLDVELAPALAMEVDGYAWHWSPEHKQRDEHRRNLLRLQGLLVLVYTWKDVVERPERIVQQVRAALAGAATGQRPWTGSDARSPVA